MYVTGMQCGGGSNKISPALSAVPWVEGVQVSPASGRVTIRFNEQRTSPHRMEAAVISSAFDVTHLSAD